MSHNIYGDLKATTYFRLLHSEMNTKAKVKNKLRQLGVTFLRFFNLISPFGTHRWENNDTLAQRLVTHLKSSSAKRGDLVEIQQIYNRMISHYLKDDLKKQLADLLYPRPSEMSEPKRDLEENPATDSSESDGSDDGLLDLEEAEAPLVNNDDEEESVDEHHDFAKIESPTASSERLELPESDAELPSGREELLAARFDSPFKITTDQAKDSIPSSESDEVLKEFFQVIENCKPQEHLLKIYKELAGDQKYRADMREFIVSLNVTVNECSNFKGEKEYSISQENYELIKTMIDIAIPQWREAFKAFKEANPRVETNKLEARLLISLFLFKYRKKKEVKVSSVKKVATTLKEIINKNVTKARHEVPTKTQNRIIFLLKILAKLDKNRAAKMIEHYEATLEKVEKYPEKLLDSGFEVLHPEKNSSVVEPVSDNPLAGFFGYFGNLYNLLKSYVSKEDSRSVNFVKASKYIAAFSAIKAPSQELQSPLLQRLQDLLSFKPSKVETDYSSTYLEQIRKTYRSVLAVLRDLVKDDSLPAPVKDYVQTQCYNLYTQVDLSDENENLLKMLSQYEGAQGVSSGEPLMKRLKDFFEVLKDAPTSLSTPTSHRIVRSVLDALCVDFSPIQRNIAQQMTSLEMVQDNKTKTIEILGMGSPTQQDILYNMGMKAEIDPLFRGFLLYLKERGLKFYYNSFQNNQADDERPRNFALMQLEKEFPGTFFCSIFSKNSSFYKGKGKEKTASAHAEALLNEFFGEETETKNSQLPSYIRNDPKKKQEMAEEARKALSGLMKFLGYADENPLTPEQKLFINEVFYAFLQIRIKAEVNPDFTCFVCKDGIDRGVGALAWFLFFILAMDDKMEEEKLFEFMKKILFPRAYWARKRPPLEERVDVFEKMGQKLLEILGETGKRDELKKILLNFCPMLKSLQIKNFKPIQF